MPPKTKSSQPSKKTAEKKKEKVIEDKTFGLKNKKGAKQQRFIQQVQNQVNSTAVKKFDDFKKQEKDKKLKEQKEMNLLFRPVVSQKLEKGADPKSVLCVFFKQGQCNKGDRCKFSHDLSLERKSEKRSMYVDMRDECNDNMDSWDDEKLKDVVEKKHGKEGRKMPQTDIICKYFLEAVEKSKYGWFWTCPNGANCIYKHALPPGFTLRNRCKQETAEEISLEELIEKERAALGVNQTRITLETFLAWKKGKLKEKKEEAIKLEEKKHLDYKAGKHTGLSGRDMFFFNPDLAEADQFDEGDDAIDTYGFEEYEDNCQKAEYREISLDVLESQAQDVDGTGTQASGDRLKDIAAAYCEDSASAMPINENLFMEDDLDVLEECISDLDLREM